MTDQSQNAQTPIEVLDADGLVKSLIATMPSLAPLHRVLPKVAALVTFHRVGVFSAQEALDQLEVAGITVATTRPIIDTMDKMVLQEQTRLARLFEEKTGTALDPETLDVRERTVAELTEQATYRQKAVDLKARVEALREFLFPEVPAPRPNMVQGWIKNAREKAEDVIFQPVDQAPAILPGWQTPPVLDDRNLEVIKLTKQLNTIESIKAGLAERETSLKDEANLTKWRTLTFKMLAAIGFTPEVLKAIFEKADQLADEQVMRSELVTKLAIDDQDNFMASASAINSVRAIAKEARDYLDSAR